MYPPLWTYFCPPCMYFAQTLSKPSSPRMLCIYLCICALTRCLQAECPSWFRISCMVCMMLMKSLNLWSGTNPPHILRDLILCVTNSISNTFTTFICPARLARFIVLSVQGQELSRKSSSYVPSASAVSPGSTSHSPLIAFHGSFIYSVFITWPSIKISL